MVLKHQEERDKGAIRIRSKSKVEPGGQAVIAVDDHEDEKSTSKAKQKHLEKGKAADQKTANKKRGRKYSKRRDRQQSPIIMESLSDLKSLKERSEQTISENSSDSGSVKETGKASKKSRKRKTKSRGFCHEQGRTREVPTGDLSEAPPEIHPLRRESVPLCPDDQGIAPKKKKRKRVPESSLTSLQSEDNESRKLASKQPRLTSQEGNGIGGDGHGETVDRLKEEDGGQAGASAQRRHPEDGVKNEGTWKEKRKAWWREKRKDKRARKREKKEKEMKAKEVASVPGDKQRGDSAHLETKTAREIVGPEDETSLMPDAGGVPRVAKKDKRQAKARVEDRGGVSISEAAAKKRKQRAQAAEAVHVRGDHAGFSGEGSEAQVSKAKGRKSGGFKEEPSWTRAKGEDEAQEGEEIKIVAIKEGNCDEVCIDRLRRQALQDEIDRESGKTKALKGGGESDAHFGQWSSATFDSLERKTKFLRLMGGFKGGSAPARSGPLHAPKPNMALAPAGEKHLLQNLQAEFDQARDLKQCRGVGLGFQPAAPKRVFIDKYASKSVKFES